MLFGGGRLVPHWVFHWKSSRSIWPAKLGMRFDTAKRDGDGAELDAMGFEEDLLL
jgi:hypothetical protein